MFCTLRVINQSVHIIRWTIQSYTPDSWSKLPVPEYYLNVHKLFYCFFGSVVKKQGSWDGISTQQWQNIATRPLFSVMTCMATNIIKKPLCAAWWEQITLSLSYFQNMSIFLVKWHYSSCVSPHLNMLQRLSGNNGLLCDFKALSEGGTLPCCFITLD